MAYRVKNAFADLQDGNYEYSVGDEYPRKGHKVSDERLRELSSETNLQGKPLIEQIKKATPKAETKENKR